MVDKNIQIENDFLSFGGDKEIKKIIKEEIILFTDKISKINEYGFNQERNIIITDKAVYNIKKKSLKRRIDINALKGITISKATDVDEFVIHGNEAEYDYYYISSKKKKIVEIIGRVYLKLVKRDLKLCYIDLKSLKNVVTGKKEKKKDQTFSKMPESNLISYSEFLKQISGRSQSVSGNRRSGTLYSKYKDVKEVKLEDFIILKVLGRGSFGKVMMVEYKPTKEIFAMKALKKDLLIDQDQIENTLLEKKILSDFQHPFLCCMIFCFQTVERVYFIMPFLRGGELFQLLRKHRIFDEEKVRFYAPQIAMALQHLHSSDIIYRDVKPENILFDEEGFLKLADFGMAKILKENEKTNSFCGTPEYLCPEIINEEGYDKSADWWSFGILLYEMLCGIPPFYNENTERMYELIKHSDIRFPKKIKISADAQDIIIKLLDKNPKNRLGATNGIKEIKSHPFFLNTDFDLILKKKLVPPFKPELSNKYDVRNFDDEFTQEPIQDSIIEESNLLLIQNNRQKFVEFDKK